MLLAMLGALLLPTSGLIRGLNGIIRNGKFLGRGFGLKKIWAAATSTPDYQTAAASGALCMLVRTPKWQPRERDEINEVILRNRYTLDAQSAKDSEDSTTGATFVSPTRSALHRVKGDISYV